MKVHLGYELATGADVEIPLGHLVVSGQTQLSGKTTTLDAIVHRSKLRAIAFVTKRGEGSFAGAREIPPFYRSPKSGVMWQYVSEVLQSKLGEKLKFERKWIMRVSKAAFSLWDVHSNVKRELAKPKLSEWDRGVFEQLDAYFELVLPELEMIAGDARTATSQAALLPTLNIAGGINVMRLEKFSTETQMLCVASVLEHVYQNEDGVITIVPEAWEMVPQGRNTPVKAAAATMFRKGAGLKNFVWFDSQDLAGVDKQALKQVSVWILGVQREENEAKRMIEHLDVGGPKPKLGEVRTLGIGEFFVSYGKQLRKVYVQPRGVPDELARKIAIGKASIDEAKEAMKSVPAAVAAGSIRENGMISLQEFLNRGFAAQKSVDDIIERHSTKAGAAPGRVMATGSQAAPIHMNVGDDAPPVRVTREGTTHVFAYDNPSKEEDEEAMENERIRELERTVDGLKIILVGQYEKLLSDHGVPGFSPHPGRKSLEGNVSKRETAKLQPSAAEAAVKTGDWGDVDDPAALDALYELIKARLVREAPALLKLVADRPEIRVEVQRRTVEVNDSTLKGKLALMVARGFFDQTATGNSAFNDLKSRGVATAKPNVYRELDVLTSLGFLLKSGDGYTAIPEMKVEIRKAANA